MHSLAFLGNLFQLDGLVVLILGLLIFGRKLPEVGKNLGQTIVEFKKGLSGQALDESVLPPEPERPVKRVDSGRVSVSRTKSLPSTEEV